MLENSEHDQEPPESQVRNVKLEYHIPPISDGWFLTLQHFEGKDYYKFRIGTYRALIDVDKQRKIVFVRHLDHRSKIYKKK
tara:strand:+ start:107 stop:349 length:243 start_codon:yes stop_codon:yes gene_type:complete